MQKLLILGMSDGPRLFSLVVDASLLFKQQCPMSTRNFNRLKLVAGL